ncbi:MAG TPA: hypothetical protein VNZ58_12895 [Thermomicrobiales bacterium]|nr:hypothetical protein [Thermomicrobiales bacterium]
MKRVMLFLAVLASLGLAAPPVAMARSDADIGAVSQAVTAADLDTLLANLKTSPSNDQLPAGFTNAEFADPATITGDARVIRPEDFESAVATVTYTVDWDPTATDATAVAAASPVSDAVPIRFASLNYLFYDATVESGDLDELLFGTEGRPTPESTNPGEEVSVENVDLDDTSGVLVTYTLQENGVQAVVQLVAIPAGKAIVMATVVEASRDGVDADVAAASVEALVVAGADYLGTVAEHSR